MANFQAKGNPKWLAGKPSTNPSGRPLAITQIAKIHARELARLTDDGLELRKWLLALFRDPTTSLDDKKWAFEEIMNRMVGKAPLTVDVTVEENHTHTVKMDLSVYTEEELQVLEQIQRQALVRAAIPANVIDVK